MVYPFISIVVVVVFIIDVVTTDDVNVVKFHGYITFVNGLTTRT